MADQTVTFGFSIGEKITVTSTGRDGWVIGLFVGADDSIQYNINTTKVTGEPIQIWARLSDLAAAANQNPPA